MVPRSSTYHYYIDIQFNVEGIQARSPQKLRANIDNDLYSRVKEGSEIKVQYATADPRVILIGPEILGKSASSGIG